MDRADFLKLLGLGAAVKIAESVTPTKLVAAEPPPAKPAPEPLSFQEPVVYSCNTTSYFSGSTKAFFFDPGR